MIYRMGIERFFSSIEENQITNLKAQFASKHDNVLKGKYFFIDFNSIVHTTSFEITAKINYILYHIIDNTVNNKYDNSSNFIDVYGIKIKKDISSEDFVKTFANDVLNEIIISGVIKYTLTLLEKFLSSKDLEVLYIAIDGVPSKAKMIEQRKRRYMGSMLTDMKKIIFGKHKQTLQQNKKRFMYESLKIGWNKNQIGPGTDFMHKLHSALICNEFKKAVIDICPNMKDFICSGPYEPGEGEKKIVDYLRSKKMEQSTYIIYSPDSDVTLLALLLNNPKSDKDKTRISFLKILRHNQQKRSYEVIDVDKLADNIYSYVQQNVDHKLNKNNVVDDVVFILTVFGNDFLPKIESMNVKYDFTKLIDRYIQTLKNKADHIIHLGPDGRKKHINSAIFLEFIKMAHIDEGGNLQKIYLSSHYRNYTKLKTIIDAKYDNFTVVMNDFLATVEKFHTDMKQDPLGSIIKKWNKKQTFIKTLMQLCMLKNIEENDDFIKIYYDFYQKEHKFPKIRISLQPYTKSLTNYFHQTNFKDSLTYMDLKLVPTEYDKEIYKFEHMLDEYQDKLSAYDLELGKISLDKHSYTWKAEKIEKGVKKYYYKFFDIKDMDCKSIKMEKLLKEYVKGLVWVFEYYFNNFNPKKYASVWTYPYLRAPLLTQIFFYLNNNKDDINLIDKMVLDVEKSFVNEEDYFNPVEHLMYVSPKNVLLSLAPKIYYGLIQESEYFINTNNIAQMIVDNSYSNVIDCRGVIFLNKCNINETVLPKIIDKKFIKLIREIEKDDDANKLSGVKL